MAHYYRQHKIYPADFPASWASGWGEDEYGLWMEFTYKRITQRLRWCEPGQFLMGSNKSDLSVPEHLLETEYQHAVTLTQGFWLADTTVTQALWRAFTGSNPSHFIGKSRPVENVSCIAVHEFISKINRMKPELKLCLPSEAEWEYACRANNNSPFYWGKQADQELVNCLPENSGIELIGRQRTIDVKALPCNNWGLYHMHGNVKEWTRDWDKPYPRYPAINPDKSAIGKRRVLRGGSWGSTQSHCRSAYRSFKSVFHRDRFSGFRLAHIP